MAWSGPCPPHSTIITFFLSAYELGQGNESTVVTCESVETNYSSTSRNDDGVDSIERGGYSITHSLFFPGLKPFFSAIFFTVAA